MNNKKAIEARLFEISGMVEAAYLIRCHDSIDSILHNIRESIDTLFPLINDLQDHECETTAGNCSNCGGFHG